MKKFSILKTLTLEIKGVCKKKGKYSTKNNNLRLKKPSLVMVHYYKFKIYNIWLLTT